MMDLSFGANRMFDIEETQVRRFHDTQTREIRGSGRSLSTSRCHEFAQWASHLIAAHKEGHHDKEHRPCTFIRHHITASAFDTKWVEIGPIEKRDSSSREPLQQSVDLFESPGGKWSHLGHLRGCWQYSCPKWSADQFVHRSTGERAADRVRSCSSRHAKARLIEERAKDCP